jgi:hypothetical protein
MSTVVDLNKIKLLDIIPLKENIHLENQELPLNTNYNIKVETKSRFKKGKGNIHLHIAIKITGYDKAKNPNGITGYYTYKFIFDVLNMDDLVSFDTSNKNATPNTDLMKSIINIAYSTIRGMLFLRTHATPLNGIILPVMNPEELE